MAAELLRSAYEVARDERIARNKQLMQDLDLVSTTTTSASSSNVAVAAPSSKPPRKRQQRLPTDEPLRRSSRHVPKDPETIAREALDEARALEARREAHRVKRLSSSTRTSRDREEREEEEDEDEEQIPYTAAEMREKISQLEALHEDRGTSYRNPTATYEHTYMRIRTMSNKALRTRVKVIENARGRDCVVKMRMFAEMLLLCAKPSLARGAQEALDRLLVGAPLER